MSLIFNVPESQMHRLAQSWGVPLQGNRRQDVPALYREMIDPWTVRTILESINAAELTILGEILTHPRAWRAVAALLVKLPFDKQALEAHLQTLHEAGLLWTMRAVTRGNEMLGPVGDADQAPTTADMEVQYIAYIPADLARVLVGAISSMAGRDRTQESLHQRLNSEDQRTLQQIATRWNISQPFGYFKRELIQHIEEAMAEPEAVQKLLETLSVEQRTIYRHVESREGICTIAEVRTALNMSDQLIRDQLRQMQDTYLLHEGYDAGGRRVLCIPPDLVRGYILIPLRQEVPVLVEQPTPIHVQNAEYTLASDLIALLVFFEQNDVELNQTDMRIPKRLRSRMNSLLLGGNTVSTHSDLRLDFLFHFLLRLRLVRRRDSQLVISEKGKAWTSLTFAEQYSHLYRNWSGDDHWREPFQFDVPFTGSNGLSSMRKRISSWLSDAVPGKWYSMESLQARVQATDPFIIRPPQQKTPGAARPTEAEGWNQIEARMLNSIVATSLYWMGILAVDFGESQSSLDSAEDTSYGTTRKPRNDSVEMRLRTSNPPQVRNFCITELGAWILGLPDATHPADTSGATLLVQPTFEVLVFQPEAQTMLMLNRIATLLRADRVAVYQLNREALLRTLDTTDLRISGIVSFLAQTSQRELPQNVIYSLNDWSRSYQRAALADVTLLEVDNANQLNEIERVLPHLIVRRITGTVAVIQGDIDEETLVQQLRGIGFFPRWHVPEEPAVPPKKKRTAAES